MDTYALDPLILLKSSYHVPPLYLALSRHNDPCLTLAMQANEPPLVCRSYLRFGMEWNGVERSGTVQKGVEWSEKGRNRVNRGGVGNGKEWDGMEWKCYIERKKR